MTTPLPPFPMDALPPALQQVVAATHVLTGASAPVIASGDESGCPLNPRLEACLRSPTHSPSFATLRKYAHACGKQLIITLV